MNSTVGSLENEFVHCQARFHPLSLRSAPLIWLQEAEGRQEKTTGMEGGKTRAQTGGSRGVLIQQIAEGLMEIISRRRWSSCY